MAPQPIPTTVAQLLAAATQAAANTNKHRAAMAEVAKIARERLPVPPQAEGVTE